MTFSRRSFILLTLATLGCASGTASKSSTPTSTPNRDRNRITAEQLARITANNAYEAIQQLQPQWLADRGINTINGPKETAVVYVDGSRFGDLDNLRGMQLSNVAEIRYLTSAEASNRYGMGLTRGVIEVITKR
jgi:hypothetical protein